MRQLVMAPLVMALLVAVAAGCQPGLDQPRASASLDVSYFRCRVQPVLAKSCATFACHGDGRRYFRVYARNRLRLTGDETTRNAAMSDDEYTANFDSARALVDPANPGDSFFLKKPLETAAGGYYHRGALIYAAGNVFATREDPDFAVLTAWVGGATEEPTCVEPGSDL
jgi:hypothetical protein